MLMEREVKGKVMKVDGKRGKDGSGRERGEEGEA